MTDGLPRIGVTVTSRSLRFSSLDDLPASLRSTVAKSLGHAQGQPVATPATKPRKYRNVITEIDGIRFDSKREAAFYGDLKLLKASGQVSYWLRQVSVHLPGGTRYVVDFLVFYTDGRVEYIDVKGKQTPEFKIKKREIEHHYPIQITIR